MTLTADLTQRFAQHRDKLEKQSLAELCSHPGRTQTFVLDAAQLTLDFSKQLCTSETLKLFDGLCSELDLRTHISGLFGGSTVNQSEGRPALHTSLRSEDASSPFHADVARAQADMRSLVDALHHGEAKGFNGQPFTDVVHIGIGGSDLGPRFVTTALRDFWHPDLRVHYVSNIDPDELADTLRDLNPARTLFITASKSFTTLETLSNTTAARHWLETAAVGRSVDDHFIAITANTAGARAFGISATRILPMWDWVGGRFSLWSAIGLPIAIAVGWDSFKALLHGAATMDAHYRSAPFTANMPALLALLEWWYSTYWQAQSALVLPYSHRLRLFPAFLQQLSMESLGKSVHLDGQPLVGHSGMVIWGEAGTNSQHSFMQLLHQGTRFIPVDFVAVARPGHETDNRHTHLYANCLSQSRTLMVGKSRAQAEQELAAAGLLNDRIQAVAPHKIQPGNRPSNTLWLEQLTPERLGALIALYEHKVFTQSILWDINAFDQWGVELGKQAATAIFGALEGNGVADFDASTEHLIERFSAAKR